MRTRAKLTYSAALTALVALSVSAASRNRSPARLHRRVKVFDSRAARHCLAQDG